MKKIAFALAAVLACVSFLLFAAAKSLAAYYFAGAVAGVSYALGSMVPASILMRRWFRAHSGLAIGICSAGTGLATVVFSPLFTAIAESGVDFVSVGYVTHSAPSLDLGLDFSVE